MSHGREAKRNLCWLSEPINSLWKLRSRTDFDNQAWCPLSWKLITLTWFCRRYPGAVMYMHWWDSKSLLSNRIWEKVLRLLLICRQIQHTVFQLIWTVISRSYHTRLFAALLFSFHFNYNCRSRLTLIVDEINRLFPFYLSQLGCTLNCQYISRSEMRGS